MNLFTKTKPPNFFSTVPLHEDYVTTVHDHCQKCITSRVEREQILHMLSAKRQGKRVHFVGCLTSTVVTSSVESTMLRVLPSLVHIGNVKGPPIFVSS